MQWGVIKYLIDHDSPAYSVIRLNISDKLRLYGVCLGKAMWTKLHTVKLDCLPSTHNKLSLARKDIQGLAKGEEELPYTAGIMKTDLMIEECAEVQSPLALKPKAINYFANPI